MRYRAEIDGLRAVSVISVILYHLGLAFPRAGLLGVDVFFVISGYLITNHIAEQLDRGCFSLSRFYERRARRILPALAVMLVLSLPFAYALMLPDDLENYGQSLVATALFANNVLLYLTSGYFELEAGFKPLLHTWSLGVEEQYYLAVPLMMMAAFALGRRRGAMVAIALVTVASFIACLWLSRADPKANFFLIFSRMWELGAGAAAGFVEPRLRALLSDGVQSLLATLGLGLVIASLAFIPAEALLPNGWTLVPVIGACLILALGSTRGAGGRLLSLRPIVFVGLISYSLYLYHQPVFAFTRIATLEEPSIWIRAALVAPIFGLAWLSWRFIERPYRDVRVTPRGLLLAMTLGSTGLCVALGLAIYGTSGFHAAWPELASGDSGFGARQNIGFNERPYRYRTVDISGVAGPSVLVLGNSFARDFINMAEETGRLRGYAVRYSESGECRFPMPDDL
ncbi:MAG: acyltransferase, partial [Caulobacteraceae bacterium]|nr:acyltransferase [Caulobacteraceae bacterium]